MNTTPRQHGTTGEVVVPVLTFGSPGAVDILATRRYGARAATTWVDRFIVSGSTTRGDLLTVNQRAALLDLWLDLLPADRLLACCWCEDDFTQARQRGIAPLAVLRNLPNPQGVARFLNRLPTGSYVYSHPMYTTAVLDAEACRQASQQGTLPAGGKLAKIHPEGIRAIRRMAGPGFALWDGSSRRLADSLQAGASGVVATPLAVFPHPFPARERAAVQTAVTAVQQQLDTLPNRSARTAHLLALARAADR